MTAKGALYEKSYQADRRQSKGAGVPRENGLAAFPIHRYEDNVGECEQNSRGSQQFLSQCCRLRSLGKTHELLGGRDYGFSITSFLAKIHRRTASCLLLKLHKLKAAQPFAKHPKGATSGSGFPVSSVI